MDPGFILAAINTLCICVVLVVIAFLYIEYNRFKQLHEEITYYLNKTAPAPASAPTPASVSSTPATSSSK